MTILSKIIFDIGKSIKFSRIWISFIIEVSLKSNESKGFIILHFLAKECSSKKLRMDCEHNLLLHTPVSKASSTYKSISEIYFYFSIKLLDTSIILNHGQFGHFLVLFFAYNLLNISLIRYISANSKEFFIITFG